MDKIIQAQQMVRQAKRILCITGAGLSADSGLPTYRGIGGLYDNSETEDGMPIEMALSGPMLEKRPELTWKYIGQIEASSRLAGPNAAHYALVKLEQQAEVTILTQNVDGFHRQAGSRNVIEIHGNVQGLSCMDCPHHEQVENYAGLEIPPSCPACMGMLRPDVVLFGEMLPEPAINALEASLQAGFDLVISIGTTSVFPYIAGPVELAASAGLPSIEINPGQTEVSHLVSLKIADRAANVLPKIV